MATNEQDVHRLEQQEADEAGGELFGWAHADVTAAQLRQAVDTESARGASESQSGPETDPQLVREDEEQEKPGSGGESRDRGGLDEPAEQLPANAPVADLELGGRDFAKEHGYYDGLQAGRAMPRALTYGGMERAVAVPRAIGEAGPDRAPAEVPRQVDAAAVERPVDPEVQRVADLARTEAQMRNLSADTRAADVELRGLALRNPKDEHDQAQIAAVEQQRDEADQKYIDLSIQHGPEASVRAELSREYAQLTPDQRDQLANAYPDLAETAATAAERSHVERGGLGAEREGHELEISR